MDPITAFLMSMQAAGLITSIWGAHNQEKFIKMGRQLEQEQFTTNLQAIKLQSASESLDEIKDLRKNIGSQMIMDAARGNRAGGSAWGITESVTAFESDERKRRLNLMASESQLRLGNVMSSLNILKSETELGQNLFKTTANTFATTSLFNLKPEPKKAKPWVNPDTGFSWGY
jgi:hypothetical protein